MQSLGGVCGAMDLSTSFQSDRMSFVLSDGILSEVCVCMCACMRMCMHICYNSRDV